MATCEVCGKPLETGRKNARFCSSTCRSRNRRARLKREEAARRKMHTLEFAAMMARLREVLPRTAASVERFIEQNGVDCAEAAVKLVLTAYAEAVRVA